MAGPVKPKILFVDDSQLILDAMKRRFTSIKIEWDIVFCSSAIKALELMEHTPYLIVFTDLQMPGMDGLELLKTIKERHPDTVRIIISGDTDNEVILKTYDCVQQFLTKPCDASIIKRVIADTINTMTHL